MAKFAYHLSKKYFLSPKHRKLSLSSGFSIFGVFLGTAALIISLSVMNGFNAALAERLLSLRPPLAIEATDGGYFSLPDSLLQKVVSTKGVAAVSPVLRCEMILRNDKTSMGTVCWGVNVENERAVSSLWSQVVRGNLEDFAEKSIILGNNLARYSLVHPGNEVSLISPFANIPTPFGMVAPSAAFTVAAVLFTGYPEFDESFSFVSLAALQDLLHVPGKISQLKIQLDSPSQMVSVQKNIKKWLPKTYVCISHQERDAKLFHAMKLEKFAMFTILLLIYVVAGFNLLGNLLRIVQEKQGEIAILRAMGSTVSQIRNSFFLHGLSIAFAGFLPGWLLGLLLCFLQQQFALVHLSSGILPFSALPVQIQMTDSLFVFLLNLAISSLAALYPGWLSAKVAISQSIKQAV